MKYRMELNNSVLRNNRPIEAVRDVILSDIGIQFLERDLSKSGMQSSINEVLKLMKTVVNKPEYVNGYHFCPIYGDHIFTVSLNKVSTSRIDRFKMYLRKDNTSFVFMFIENIFLMKVNRRLYPLSGSDKVIAYDRDITSVFKGSKFMVDVYKERRYEDTKEIWTSTPEDIKRMITGSISVIAEDIRKYWFKVKFSATEAVFIVERFMEAVHTLMCLVEVNNNYFDFKERPLAKDLAMELLDRELSSYFADPRDPVKITETCLTLAGKIAENLAKDNYQNLFKGYTVS